MKLSSQDSHRFLRIHSNEMKVFMFTKENTLKSALFFLALVATVTVITLTIGFGGNKSLDKGSRWISLGMDEIKSIEQLNEDQALKINSHLKELNDQEELRTNKDFQNTFIEFDAAVIISIKSSLLRLAPPTKAPFTFDIENISFAFEPFTDPPYKIFTLWASAP